MVNLSMSDVLRTERWSIGFALAALVSGIAAVVLGIANGNTIAVVLAYLSAVCIVLAIFHRLQKASRFIWLAIIGLITFVAFAVLHNVLYAMGILTAGVSYVPGIMDALSAVAFFIAVLLAPAMIIVGIAGALVRLAQTRQPKAS